MDEYTMKYLIPEEMLMVGATQIAADMYPRKTQRIGYPPRAAVFAYRYFNDNDREVGYRIPDTMAADEYFIFEEPRVWADNYLRYLRWDVETHSHKPE